MDFARVIDEIGGFLTSCGSRSAVAGGVALAVYGHPRLTLDLDIVTVAGPGGRVIPVPRLMERGRELTERT